MIFDLTLEDEPGEDSNSSSGISSNYTNSAKIRDEEINSNPFRFTPDAIRRSHSASVVSSNGSAKDLEAAAESPTSVQKSLCLNATSALEIAISDSDDELSPATQRKLCLCASQNPKQTQEAGQRTRLDSQNHSFPYHTHQITEDYTVSSEIIGIGESGKVMACYNKKTGEKLALKVLRDGPKARREVDLHYLTNGHENVVSIIDIYENTFHDVKCLLMVCEFMEGGDLLTQFENQSSKPYTEEKVGEIIRQIGAAVMYLHDMNIAHRDIKLENILCSTTGEDCVYKLGDYGFAKRPERNVLMESPCCTPFYAPPEVLGRERYDKSCDMWSLGVAMYILLCGYPPFYSMKGLALSPGMRSRIAKGYYAFPHAEWDSVSQATKDDIRCLLRTNPSERMTIHELMNTPLVRGEDAPPTSAPLAIPGEDMDDGGVSIGIRRPSETLSFMPDDHDEEDLMHHADEVHDKIPDEIPKSVRFLRDGVKAPRLHSIQEEVGRALEMMRMGGDAVYVKQPNLAVCSNPLLAKRYKTAHMSISSVHCS